MITGAAVLAALAGCASTASDDGAAPAPTPTTGGAMSPTSSPPPGVPPGRPPLSVPGSPASPGKPGSGEITVTGQVELIEIEGGCLVLRAGGQAYQLIGVDQRTAQPGARLTVRGRVRTDVATTCQVGPVLEALEVRPA